MIAPEDGTQKMKTLSESLNKALKDGYEEQFKVSKKGLLSADESKVYAPEEVSIVDFFRFEGYSDPEDNSILYLISTPDGLKGTLIDTYGVYADPVIAAFIRDVEEIRKKV